MSVYKILILCLIYKSVRRNTAKPASVPSYRSISSCDVLQGSNGSLLGVVTHAAGDQWQVHPDSDGAPQPLYATGISFLLQQGALSLQLLGGNRWWEVFFRRVHWVHIDSESNNEWYFFWYCCVFLALIMCVYVCSIFLQLVSWEIYETKYFINKC